MGKEELWEELKFEVENLKKRKGLSNQEVILGSGNKGGKLLFVGDDKNLYQSEDLRFEMGSSGEFLIKLCDLAEILPQNYYIINLTKQEIKFRDFFEEERKKILELFDMQVYLIEPRLIVLFGKSVAEAVLRKEVNLKEERGKFFKWKGGIECLITYDVEYIKNVRENTGRKSRAALDFWKDLQTIKSKMEKIYE